MFSWKLFIGCSDSYGYATPAPDGDKGLATNYTPPHVTSDGFQPAPSSIYALNGIYPAESITDGLKTLFDQLSIGTGPRESAPEGSTSWFPSMQDKAWRSYRLKGSQVNFTDSAGRPQLLGNSVTEAGFVTSSSCVTCHSRAHVNKCGQSFSLGVFEPVTGFQGYSLSSNGTPNPSWFNQNNNGNPAPLVLQADFVWGFLNAQSTKPKEAAPCTP